MFVLSLILALIFLIIFFLLNFFLLLPGSYGGDSNKLRSFIVDISSFLIYVFRLIILRLLPEHTVYSPACFFANAVIW